MLGFIKPEISIGDAVALLGLAIATIGVFLAYRQIRQANRHKRAEFVMDFYRHFTGDADIQNIYYKIEYEQFRYDQNTFHNSQEEKQIDKLLHLFCSIARLWKTDVIGINDIGEFAYEYLRVYRNENVKQYIKGWLDEWFPKTGIRIKPFGAFLELSGIGVGIEVGGGSATVSARFALDVMEGGFGKSNSI
jgi:hypothetical protein